MHSLSSSSSSVLHSGQEASPSTNKFEMNIKLCKLKKGGQALFEARSEEDSAANLFQLDRDQILQETEKQKSQEDKACIVKKRRMDLHLAAMLAQLNSDALSCVTITVEDDGSCANETAMVEEGNALLDLLLMPEKDNDFVNKLNEEGKKNIEAVKQFLGCNVYLKHFITSCEQQLNDECNLSKNKKARKSAGVSQELASVQREDESNVVVNLALPEENLFCEAPLVESLTKNISQSKAAYSEKSEADILEEAKNKLEKEANKLQCDFWKKIHSAFHQHFEYDIAHVIDEKESAIKKLSQMIQYAARLISFIGKLYVYSYAADTIGKEEITIKYKEIINKVLAYFWQSVASLVACLNDPAINITADNKAFLLTLVEHCKNLEKLIANIKDNRSIKLTQKEIKALDSSDETFASLKVNVNKKIESQDAFKTFLTIFNDTEKIRPRADEFETKKYNVDIEKLISGIKPDDCCNNEPTKLEYKYVEREEADYSLSFNKKNKVSLDWLCSCFAKSVESLPESARIINKMNSAFFIPGMAAPFWGEETEDLLSKMLQHSPSYERFIEQSALLFQASGANAKENKLDKLHKDAIASSNRLNPHQNLYHNQIKTALAPLFAQSGLDSPCTDWNQLQVILTQDLNDIVNQALNNYRSKYTGNYQEIIEIISSVAREFTSDVFSASTRNLPAKIAKKKSAAKQHFEDFLKDIVKAKIASFQQEVASKGIGALTNKPIDQKKIRKDYHDRLYAIVAKYVCATIPDNDPYSYCCLHQPEIHLHLSTLLPKREESEFLRELSARLKKNSVRHFQDKELTPLKAEKMALFFSALSQNAKGRKPSFWRYIWAVITRFFKKNTDILGKASNGNLNATIGNEDKEIKFLPQDEAVWLDLLRSYRDCSQEEKSECVKSMLVFLTANDLDQLAQDQEKILREKFLEKNTSQLFKDLSLFIDSKRTKEIFVELAGIHIAKIKAKNIDTDNIKKHIKIMIELLSWEDVAAKDVNQPNVSSNENDLRRQETRKRLTHILSQENISDLLLIKFLKHVISASFDVENSGEATDISAQIQVALQDLSENIENAKQKEILLKVEQAVVIDVIAERFVALVVDDYEKNKNISLVKKDLHLSIGVDVIFDTKILPFYRRVVASQKENGPLFFQKVFLACCYEGGYQLSDEGMKTRLELIWGNLQKVNSEDARHDYQCDEIKANFMQGLANFITTYHGTKNIVVLIEFFHDKFLYKKDRTAFFNNIKDALFQVATSENAVSQDLIATMQGVIAALSNDQEGMLILRGHFNEKLKAITEGKIFFDAKIISELSQLYNYEKALYDCDDAIQKTQHENNLNALFAKLIELGKNSENILEKDKKLLKALAKKLCQDLPKIYVLKTLEHEIDQEKSQNILTAVDQIVALLINLDAEFDDWIQVIESIKGTKLANELLRNLMDKFVDKHVVAKKNNNIEDVVNFEIIDINTIGGSNNKAIKWLLFANILDKIGGLLDASTQYPHLPKDFVITESGNIQFLVKTTIDAASIVGTRYRKLNTMLGCAGVLNDDRKKDEFKPQNLEKYWDNTIRLQEVYAFLIDEDKTTEKKQDVFDTLLSCFVKNKNIFCCFGRMRFFFELFKSEKQKKFLAQFLAKHVVPNKEDPHQTAKDLTKKAPERMQELLENCQFFFGGDTNKVNLSGFFDALAEEIFDFVRPIEDTGLKTLQGLIQKNTRTNILQSLASALCLVADSLPLIEAFATSLGQTLVENWNTSGGKCGKALQDMKDLIPQIVAVDFGNDVSYAKYISSFVFAVITAIKKTNALDIKAKNKFLEKVKDALQKSKRQIDCNGIILAISELKEKSEVVKEKVKLSISKNGSLPPSQKQEEEKRRDQNEEEMELEPSRATPKADEVNTAECLVNSILDEGVPATQVLVDNQLIIESSDQGRPKKEASITQFVSLCFKKLEQKFKDYTASKKSLAKGSGVVAQSIRGEINDLLAKLKLLFVLDQGDAKKEHRDFVLQNIAGLIVAKGNWVKDVSRKLIVSVFDLLAADNSRSEKDEGLKKKASPATIKEVNNNQKIFLASIVTKLRDNDNGLEKKRSLKLLDKIEEIVKEKNGKNIKKSNDIFAKEKDAPKLRYSNIETFFSEMKNNQSLVSVKETTIGPLRNT